MSSVLEYIPLLQAFVDHNSTTEAVEEEFEAAASVPTVFYNKEKMGKPTDGEILLLALHRSSEPRVCFVGTTVLFWMPFPAVRCWATVLTTVASCVPEHDACAFSAGAGVHEIPM